MSWTGENDNRMFDYQTPYNGIESENTTEKFYTFEEGPKIVSFLEELVFLTWLITNY